MVLDHEGEHSCRWAAVSSIAAKSGCATLTQHEWVNRAKVGSGQRLRLTTDMVAKVKALERENRELRQAYGILRNARASIPSLEAVAGRFKAWRIIAQAQPDKQQQKVTKLDPETA